MLKVGDYVCLNPKYILGSEPNIRGIISNRPDPIFPLQSNAFIIDWEDGKQGTIFLDEGTQYVILI